MVGGHANILFADLHDERIYDLGGRLESYGDPSNPVDNKPDGFFGPYKRDDRADGVTFEINQSALDEEIRGKLWFGRLRQKTTPGGGSIE